MEGMEEIIVNLSIPLKTAEYILSNLKSLEELKKELEIEIKRSKYKNIKYIPGPEIKLLKETRDKTIKECYIKYKNMGTKEMIKKTRKEVEHLPWCSWDLVYAELRKVKKELEPKKGQLWLFKQLV